jgi:diguanylate cyclase (GGDEF)-like protein
VSFRGRLTLFFVAIVVLPMIAVAVLVVQVTEDSANGKADARLATGLETAQQIYDRALLKAPDEVDALANTPDVQAALRAPNETYLGKVAEQEVESGDAARVAFYDGAGELIAEAGADDALARSRRPLRDDSGLVGEIEVGLLTPERYTDQVASLTDVGATVIDDGGLLASTVEVGEADLPAGGGASSVETEAGEFRAAALRLEGATPGARIVLTTPEGEGFVANAPEVAIVLALFFALATFLIFVVVRMLQGQIATMLDAARRIGSGDFSKEVPVEGDDELAGLAREFNKMSEQLDRQMHQLQHQREELDQSVRRIGEAFASGLDREALLEIVVETALAACEAERGQILLAGHDTPEATVGKPQGEEWDAALAEASSKAIAESSLAEVSREGIAAIAHPLIRAGEELDALGTMAIARKDRPFDANEREVLRYLIGQASVSVENIGLHERVSEQAVTDALTGLANNRRFREWIDLESQRLGRFGGELSLLLLDLDDFKYVNDTYGHLQGDEVLRTMGRVLREESRGIDEPARYGGEEFVLALPETPREGALEVAERVRERIASTQIAGVDGNRPLNVTASIGVATMPADGADPTSLMAAADAAMYEAKRNGKNRVSAAG